MQCTVVLVGVVLKDLFGGTIYDVYILTLSTRKMQCIVGSYTVVTAYG